MTHAETAWNNLSRHIEKCGCSILAIAGEKVPFAVDVEIGLRQSPAG